MKNSIDAIIVKNGNVYRGWLGTIASPATVVRRLRAMDDLTDVKVYYSSPEKGFIDSAKAFLAKFSGTEDHSERTD